MKNYGWQGSFLDFIQADKDELINALCLQIYNQSLDEAMRNPQEESTIPQIRSWYDCVEYLMKEIPPFQNDLGFLVFEYEILRSGRRRPDVLVILPGEILILEFKRYSNISDAEYTQLSHYVRDIESYHSTVQDFDLKIRGGLVLTTLNDSLKASNEYQVYIIGKNQLHLLLERIKSESVKEEIISPEDFLNGDYRPLPSIIESAKKIMAEEPLPEIKSVKSSNYQHVIQEIQETITNAKINNTHHLVLVSGVPGAGKTFVGLTIAHEVENAIYLSGNKPLVDVLQDILKNRTFVQSLYGYKMDYMTYGKVPDEHVIIFDEAQRAWDAEKMNGDKSEPDVIIGIAKHKPWSVVVALIGEGQEIHLGEEGGIGLWNQAIENKSIYVHARHHQSIFPNALEYMENENLHLNTSLRTHKALHYFRWVEAFIEGNFELAKELQEKLKQDRYIVKEMRSVGEAKAYIQEVYKETNKTYGIVISSGIKYPKDIKVLPYNKHVPYFNHQDSPYFCRNLEYAATEFQTQGLELDMVILYWGKDLVYDNNTWKFNYLKQGVKNPYQMKLNAYRVLLTRGRDGVIIVNG